MTLSYRERTERHRRLIVLRALARANGGRLNERDLEVELDLMGHRVTRDEVRALLRWLGDADAVRLSYPYEVIMVAELTRRGEDHLERRGDPIEGVDLPSRA